MNSTYKYKGQKHHIKTTKKLAIINPKLKDNLF